MPAPTPNQLRAIEATGNVLVMAGAGTGKTRTLVERCLARLLDPDATGRCSLDEVLMVTFTEAAAAEVRRRIRDRLTVEAETAGSASRGELIAEQLALVDTARISTLHGFCLQLLREHFQELALDPQFSVLDPSRARILAAETLERLLDEDYSGVGAESEAVRQLILAYGGGRDDVIRHLVLRLHHYVQTLPDPDRWISAQEAEFAAEQPPHWEEWLRLAFLQFVERWSAPLAASEHPILQDCCLALTGAQPHGAGGRSAIYETYASILAADQGDWKRQKTKVRSPFTELFNDAAFLASLARSDGGPDPLVEDWGWVRPHLLALLRLTRRFGIAFGAAKRELAAVDFHDLEQFALRLLWDPANEVPTATAQRWQRRFRHVFVDEYQDINAAQDRILCALSREGQAANRFLVGDVKQSIYRFRLANPRIFQRYAREWVQPGAEGQVIPLSENFRNHEAILEFVNTLFAGCMRGEVGGVDYGASAQLHFGNPAGRPHFARDEATDQPRVELHLHPKGEGGIETDPDEADPTEVRDDFLDLSETEQEAHLVARRLARLQAEGLPVWDESARTLRPVEWRDMVVLLRAPRTRAEAFAKVFEAVGIPLVTSRRGLYQAIEVSDLLNLLTLLDNPLQDLPLLAVLRSPLVGLTLDELAIVRLAERKAQVWTALRRFHRTPPVGGDSPAELAGALAWPKVDGFLRRYERWRTLARRGALSRCLESVLDETHYEDWLLAQTRGDQRRANVQRFLGLTRQFDQLQNRGLFRFLRFVEAQLEVDFDPEPATTEAGNAVRLMSVHQSKGLEFPVVVVAGLGQRFNQDDLRASIILDEEFGLCPLVRPASSGRMYPSLPHWLAKRRQQREALGEGLRLLYVAFTRACDRLILVGTVRKPNPESPLPSPPAGQPVTAELLSVKCDFDWLRLVAARLTGREDWWEAGQGRSRLLDWQVREQRAGDSGMESMHLAPDTQPLLPVVGRAHGTGFGGERPARFDWQYPHPQATHEPAKASVTGLRRRAAPEAYDAAGSWFADAKGRSVGPGQGDPAARGLAHHRFLELLDLGRTGSCAELEAEADRLRESGHLTAEEQAMLDLPSLAVFWAGPLGQSIREQRSDVQREVQFTARLSATDLRSLSVPAPAGLGEDEFVVVQGVADLVVLLPDALWVMDFKTDAVGPGALAEKVRLYRPQLALYALALGRIFDRPVTAAWLHFLASRESASVPLAHVM